MDTETENQLEWFVQNSANIKREYGFSKFSLVQFNDGHFGFEFKRAGDAYTYQTECIERLRMMADFPPDLPVEAPRIPSVITRKTVREVRPNDRCTCGSGRKFKKCCMYK